MSGSFGLAFFVAATCGQLIILLTVVVDAQSTESESASCESSALDEAVHLIRGDLRDVKSVCASCQQQQPSAVDTTSLCEYRTRPRPAFARRRRLKRCTIETTDLLTTK